ncbi:MAG: hypothetical protein JXA03_08405, partial [Bacteroidales bacterium]|nr:hypothetical protein [Bacteroidales bacterium]
WDSTWTWVQGIVPNAAHDVTINGPVYSSNNACQNLTIQPGGELYNNYYSYSLSVYGNVTNNGTIAPYVSLFSLNIHGNIINNGVWINQYTYFHGGSDQHISCQNANPLSSYQYSNSKTGGDIYVDTEAYFKNSQLYLGWININIAANAALTLENTFLSQCNLYGSGSGSVLNGLGSAGSGPSVLEQLNIHDLTINGSHNIASTVSLYGNVFNNAFLQNDYYSYTLSIYDDFTNNGTIRTYVNLFGVNVYGNFTNNNVVENTSLDFYGTTNQQVSLAAGKNFNPAYWRSYKPSGYIEALTDLSFLNSNVELDYDSLVMQNNGTLYLSGGHFFYASLLAKDAKSGTVNYHTENSSTGFVTFHNATLTGIVKVQNAVTFLGNTVNQGTLENDYYSYNSDVYGVFTNNGTIQNNVQSLGLKIYGDFINNGIIDNHAVDFYSAEDQEITLMPGKELSPTFFTSFKPSGKIIATGGLKFTNTSINLDNDTLIMPDNSELFVSAGYLYRGKVLAANAKNGRLKLRMNNGSYIEECELFNPEFLGIVNCNTNTFHGDILVTDTLQNNYYAYAQTILGNITNNGMIRNFISPLSLNITGNIVNNGVWNNNQVNLNGSADQHVSCQNGNYFSGYEFILSNSPATTWFDNMVQFYNVQVRANNNTVRLPAGSTLLMHDGRLLNCVLQGDGPTSVLQGTGSSTGDMPEMDASSFENLSLNGEFLFNGSNVLYGPITNNAILQNNYYSQSIEVYGDFMHNGTLRNYVSNFTFNLYGNLFNHGIIDNHAIDLYGDLDQRLSMLEGNTYSPTYFSSFKTGGMVIADNSLYFHNTNINLDNTTIEMPSGSTLSVIGGYMVSSVVSPSASENGSFTLEMNNGSYLTNCNIYDFTFEGLMEVNSGNVFHGNILNNGTIRNDYYTHTLDIDGNLTNCGTIQNYITNLYINITGNITNNGNWTNLVTKLTGTSDQYVVIRNNHDITGQTQYESNTVGAPYQWFYNGSPMIPSGSYSGQNSQTLVFNIPVTSSMNGDFMYCQATGGQSRNIFFGSLYTLFDLDLKASLQGPFNGTDMNANLNSGGYLPISQPYSGDPWNYTGTEAVAAIPNQDVVDWVIVELRDAPGASGATYDYSVAAQAGFILKNGSIVGTDGVSPLTFDYQVTQNLFAIIWHRNHLGVMNSTPLVKTGNTYTYDFTTGSGQAYGGVQAHKEIAPGVWGMISADGNADGQVNNSDKNDVWSPQAGSNGYLQGDFNMDAQVNNNDKNELWKPNTGLGSQVPN